MTQKRTIYLFIGFLILGVLAIGISTCKDYHLISNYKVGQVVDSLNGVYVFYNGRVRNSTGRNLAKDGYNLGLKYQCVEFVKRYYYQHLKHKMPNASGNAKDFFNKKLADGQLNVGRNLFQYKNPSHSQPKVDDLLIFDGTSSNIYGHVAIISKVTEHEIEITQQNPGSFGKSRVKIELKHHNGNWSLKNGRVLGWLRKHSFSVLN